jgi:hypothetical protein
VTTDRRELPDIIAGAVGSGVIYQDGNQVYSRTGLVSGADRGLWPDRTAVAKFAASATDAPGSVVGQFLLVLYADGESGVGGDCGGDRGVAVLLATGPIVGYQQHFGGLRPDRQNPAMDSGLDGDCDG